jgi:hypothetical protein
MDLFWLGKDVNLSDNGGYTISQQMACFMGTVDSDDRHGGFGHGTGGSSSCSSTLIA